MFKIRILLFSDLHTLSIPLWFDFLKEKRNDFDIIITLGDIDLLFLQSLKLHYPNKEIVGVLGNHDYFGDLEYTKINNIHQKSISFQDNIISGLEGCIRYKDSKEPMYTQEEYFELIKSIDKRTNIFISHNAPKGIHDKDLYAHEGTMAKRDFIDENNVDYWFHGHLHKIEMTKYENTHVINVYGGIIFDTTTNKIEELDILFEY